MRETAGTLGQKMSVADVFLACTRRYFEPTLIGHVNENMEIAQTEGMKRREVSVRSKD